MDKCTLTDAIARIAYGRDYDGRYNGPSEGVWTQANARRLRKRDMLYPSNSGLPGTTALVGLQDEAAFTAALTTWEAADRKKWADAERALGAELVGGRISAFDESGNVVPAEFWLANDLRNRRSGGVLLRASQVEELSRRKERHGERTLERDRDRMIARFAEKQHRLRSWINFADIADWCAREGGSIRPNDLHRAIAYRYLGEALAKGEFETDGRTRVLFLNPSVRWFKMTREQFEACPIDMTSDVRILDMTTQAYLASCWIPRDMCRQWFEARRLQLPSWLFPAEVGAESMTLADRNHSQLNPGAMLSAAMNQISEDKYRKVAASPAGSDGPSNRQTRVRQNRGGRPAEWDWDGFNREVVRLADLPDGLPTRAELQNYMLDWCEQNWGKSPSDSTVRDHIARVYPK